MEPTQFFILILKQQKYRFSLPERQIFSPVIDCTLKYTKKFDRYILGFLDKSKMPGRCGFPLANLYQGASLHIVPTPTVTEDSQIFHIASTNLQFIR